MKILSLNFLSCSRKACKSSTASFPLHPRDAELEIVTIKSNPLFIRNILPRLNWEALKGLCEELGLPALPDSTPDATLLYEPGGEEPTQLAKDLQHLLLETTIQSGKLVCGNCGHEYAIREDYGHDRYRCDTGIKHERCPLCSQGGYTGGVQHMHGSERCAGRSCSRSRDRGA